MTLAKIFTHCQGLVMSNIGFVHIPKTGGVSVKRWFKAIEQPLPETVDFPKQNMLPDADWWFTIVRNPYDRMVSWYEWSILNAQAQKYWISNGRYPDEECAGRLAKIELAEQIYHKGFDTWLKEYVTVESYLYDPQASWFDHVDLICKTENLHTDFTIVKEKLGQSLELRKYNWTKKQHKVSEYYSDWSWGFVYETYKEDFEKFQYPKTHFDRPVQLFGS